MTMSVEYNQLDRCFGDDQPRQRREREGRIAVPGNINQLIVSLPEYKAQLEKTAGRSGPST